MEEIDWDRAFEEERQKALQFIEKHNAELPTPDCPQCGEDGHVPGLPCRCGYKHPVSWVILRDTEWGYAAVSLNNQRHALARFHVD